MDIKSQETAGYSKQPNSAFVVVSADPRAEV